MDGFRLSSVGKACEDRVSKGSGLGCHTYSRSRAIFLIRVLNPDRELGSATCQQMWEGKITPAASLDLIWT
jgi:hypothetical protein